MRTQKSSVIEVAVCTDHVHSSGLSQGTTIEKELNVYQQILEFYEYGIKIASIYICKCNAFFLHFLSSVRWIVI